MFALSIRQPYAELILRGVKTIEYRSRPTRRIGERFWIYASKSEARPLTGTLELPAGLDPAALPRGVIVGSAIIHKCERGKLPSGKFEWHLADVRRAKAMRTPTGRPQPVWFRPF